MMRVVPPSGLGSRSRASQAGLLVGVLLAYVLSAPGVPAGETTLVNASYDVSRELYQDINEAYLKAGGPGEGAHAATATAIQQSHAGSSRQARAVIDGLEADVVTLNQVSDIEALVAAKLVATDWQGRFPSGSSPYTSIIAFVVRQGNPKHIHDWSDLVRPDVTIAVVNPKTGGNGRYAFLSAYAYALRSAHGDADKARAFISTFYHHVTVLDSSGRAATTTFAAREIGDVLVTFEAETALIRRESGNRLDVITPSLSILAEFPVAIIDPVASRHGTVAVAESYLRFLFSDPAQVIIAEHGYRPRSAAVAARFADRFAAVEVVDVQKEFGGWAAAQQRFFADGGLFDEIYTLDK